MGVLFCAKRGILYEEPKEDGTFHCNKKSQEQRGPPVAVIGKPGECEQGEYRGAGGAEHQHAQAPVLVDAAD